MFVIKRNFLKQKKKTNQKKFGHICMNKYVCVCTCASLCMCIHFFACII